MPAYVRETTLEKDLIGLALRPFYELPCEQMARLTDKQIPRQASASIRAMYSAHVRRSPLFKDLVRPMLS